MKEYNYLLCTFSLILLGFNAFTQTLVERKEIDYAAYKTNVEVRSAGKNGVFVFYEQEEKTDQQNYWQFDFYDTTFSLLQSRVISIKENFIPITSYTTLEKALIIFGNYRSAFMNFVTIDFKNQTITKTTNELPSQFVIEYITLQDNEIYIAGKEKSGSPVCFFVNLEKRNETKRLELDANSDFEITDLSYNSYDDHCDLVLASDFDGKSELKVISIKAAEIIDTITFSNEERSNTLLNGKIIHLEKEMEALVGTYGNESFGSKGVYYATLSDSLNQREIIYYPFSEFKNLFQFLEKNKREGLASLVNNGDKEEPVYYAMSIQEVLEINKKIVLVMDAHHFTHGKESFTSKVTNKEEEISSVSERHLIDGYVWSHGMVVALDNKGNKLWDNTFDMGNFKSSIVKNIVTDGEQILLTYASGEELKQQRILEEKVHEKVHEMELGTGKESKQIISSSISNLGYWYDDYFLIAGQQKVAEKGERVEKKFLFIRYKGKEKKQVVFLDKVRFDF